MSYFLIVVAIPSITASVFCLLVNVFIASIVLTSHALNNIPRADAKCKFSLFTIGNFVGPSISICCRVKSPLSSKSKLNEFTS